MASQKEKSKFVKIIYPHKGDDGWFCFSEIEIPLEVIEKEGKLVGKTNPDVFQSFSFQLVERARQIFGI